MNNALQMHALLYVEELQQETNIRTYDMETAQLCKNLGKLLWLEVSHPCSKTVLSTAQTVVLQP